MFLNRLQEDEKVAFLELAHHIARSDDDFSEEEEDVIAIYCYEMGIPDVHYENNAFDLAETRTVFKSRASQKILLLELMALIYSDSRFDEAEQEIINKILQIYKIDNSLIKIYAEWAKTILSVSAQGALLLEL